MEELKVLDLFSGAGGFSAGFRAAGFLVVGAVEHVQRYAETHALNFPETKLVTADISQLSPAAFQSKTGIKPCETLVLIGGPPCQTFSNIGGPKIRSLGVTEKDDPRNYLFKDYLAYVDHYKPQVFVMENVPALKTKYGGRLFNKILSMIDSMGYQVKHDVLNAVSFGVPQTRKRLFIVGTRRDSSINFLFPDATHHDSNSPCGTHLFGPVLKAPTTVYDAISDLPEIFDGCREDMLPYSSEPQTQYQRMIRNAQGYVGNNICRVSNERAKAVFKYMKPGNKYMDLQEDIRKILPFREDIFHDRLKRLDMSKPSWTVLAHIGMDGYMYIHPHENRTLSVREAARIQSFPDSFRFTGNMREQYIQVGNAVPPLLAMALAKSVMGAMK